MIGTYGLLGNLNLVVYDLDLIKQVLVKDFEYLVDRRAFEFGDPVLDQMLTVLQGEKWKQMRSLITPIFTSGKLKAMLPLIDKAWPF